MCEEGKMLEIVSIFVIFLLGRKYRISANHLKTLRGKNKLRLTYFKVKNDI